MAEKNEPVILTFGGGINARQRSADINIEECTEGQNFDLNFQSSVLTRRQQIGVIAAPPNGEPIRGIAQLVKPDGSLSTIIQAGSIVYAWDGANEFTEVGSVSPDARLRGPIDSNFTLDAFIILTDLSKIENVKKWNGETFEDLEHNLLDGEGNKVDFKAKYVTVQTERAIFLNVKTGTVDTPHVILASEQGNSEVLTSTDRPAQAASAATEWFLPTPDLRPINGVVFFAKSLLISTERGRLYVLKGLIAGTDDGTETGLPFTSIEDFHAGSAVSGDEAFINIGNDVAMGLPGRIETLSGVLEFGDAETNDASWWISPLLDGTFGTKVTSWALAYDQVGQRVFCFPNTGGEAWVLHKSILFKPSKVSGTNDKISPWSRWVASDELNSFDPTAIGNIFPPDENPRLISTSPPASNTSSSGAGSGTPTLFFGFNSGVGGTIFRLAKSEEEPPTLICDVDLVPEMTSNTTPSGVASASSIRTSINDAWCAFENEPIGCTWNSVAHTIGLDTDEWLQYEFALPQIITAYRVHEAITSSNNPRDWTLSGSINGTDFTTLDTVVGATFDTQPDLVERTFNNSVAWRFYRIHITHVSNKAGSTFTQIANLELFNCLS